MTEPSYTVTVENPDAGAASARHVDSIDELHGEQRAMANLLTEHGDSVTFRKRFGAGYVTVTRYGDH